MGWAKDGSGLDVKRVRGMTLPQSVAATWNRRNLAALRESKHMSAGWLSDASWAHRRRKETRYDRRTRRAKRLAKAADRRLDTLCRLRWRNGERVLVIPPEVLRAYLKHGRHERMREDHHALGS